jgi:DeoR/GlpR family transcriptional regulator of sugar metabolism
VAASRLIDDHDTLLLDGGSTTYELARQLVGRPLQIVTNSLPVANLFASSDQVDLVLLGGYVHTRTAVSLGPYANQMLATLNVQKAFLSIAGANRRGYYNSNLLLVETERAMMNCADQTIVVADSSKFGKSSLARLCELEQVQTLVTDAGLSQTWREHLQAAHVQLVIAAASESTETAEEPRCPSVD